MKNKYRGISVLSFKVLEAGSMQFSCYGNTKGNIDHALDRTVDGAYQKSIDKHTINKTMPRMFWSHNPNETPIGKWKSMKEDSKGLYLEGEFANTDKGQEMYELMKGGHVDSFSIGYRVLQEKWNSEKSCNDLIELDIVEISAVNMPCNEESRLVDIKNRLSEGEVLSKADLRILLEDSTAGLSKRQIERVTADYNPKDELKHILESSELFQ